jgi:hypothetical protein
MSALRLRDDLQQLGARITRTLPPVMAKALRPEP